MPLGLPLELLASLDAFPEIAAGVAESVRQKVAPVERAVGDAEVFSGADAIREAESAWRQIEHEGGAATPFQSLALNEACAHAHLARNETPHVIVVRDASHPAAILPLVSTRFAGMRALRFLGDPLIQYGDAIASNCAREAHLARALEAARELGGDIAIFRKVRADARIAPLLARRAAMFAEETAPYVDTRRDSELPARDARELRRYRRRLAETGEMKFTVIRGAEAGDLVRTALRWKRDWLNARGLSSAVIGDHAWESSLARLSEALDSPLACTQLQVGGEVAAIELALVQDKRWYAFLGAINQRFAKSGPGQVQMAETIAQCRAQGFAAYDLLAPADPFKRVIATHSVSVRDYALPLSLNGRIAAHAIRFAPGAKKLLTRMPPALRRFAAAPLRLLR